jgi:NitT/TauT family transport system permease protein
VNLTARLRVSLVWLTLLGVWELVGRLGLLADFYATTPSAVAETLYTLFASGTIWPHLQATFSAALLGLVFGLLVGAALGLTAALIPFVRALLEPVMLFLNAIPRVVLAPLFIIWFGIGVGSKVALSLVLVAVLIFFAVYNGFREVDQRLVERVITLGGGRGVLLREVYGPSITSWVMSNLKVALGFAFTGAVVGEFVAASRGLGYLMTFALSTYNTAQVVALVLLIGLFVLLLFYIAGRLEARLLGWRDP